MSDSVLRYLGDLDLSEEELEEMIRENSKDKKTIARIDYLDH